MVTEIALFAFAFLGLVGCFAAYRNGVNDGYMAAQDWTCPGYAKAIRILKQFGKWREPNELANYILKSWEWQLRDKWKPIDSHEDSTVPFESKENNS